MDSVDAPLSSISVKTEPSNGYQHPSGSQNGQDQSQGPEHRSSKIAACLSCRRSKVRCEKGVSNDRCRRCSQTGSECVRPTFNVGRRKGVKNKRKGLEKALYQVEEALRRVAPEAQGTDAEKAITHLKNLLASSQDGRLNGSQDGAKRTRLMAGSSEMQDSSSDEEESPLPRKNSYRRESTISRQAVVAEERLAVYDAENPLQLLARASNLHLTPKSSSQDQSPTTNMSLNRGNSIVDDQDESEVTAFFATTHFNLDIGKGYDPIELGLVSEDEAESLFTFFHKNLAHTRWGLDPVIYTVPWTRSRSSFLFTSIMAASALFMPSAGALSKRLSNHSKVLAHKVLANRHRSTEIVLAFMINVPWMFPGVHSTDDETVWYVSMAVTIAIDLQMHKFSLPTEAFRDGSSGEFRRNDCIDPTLALTSAGFKDVDPNSELGRRLIRRRERCWIALFVLERGMCLARGRSFTMPVTSLIRRCDKWHISDIADNMDGHLVSMAVLRRDLDGIFSAIRSLCDGSREGMINGSLIAQTIQSTVEKFFEQWQLEWGMSIGSGPHHRLPPYVEILVTHTRLSIYSSVINHPTAPAEVRQFFRTASLSAALNVMRASVQGEAQLLSMPNNTAIMVSFAACFALRLSAHISGNSTLAPSVRTLIEETADVLERVGGVTKHRNGMCTLYGKYLKMLVRKSVTATNEQNSTIPQAMVNTISAPRHGHTVLYTEPRPLQTPNMTSQPQQVRAYGLPPLGDSAMPPYNSIETPPGWTGGPEPFQFSSMSDDQIVEALNRAGNEFEPNAGFTDTGDWEDTTSFDWMNWNNLPDFGFG